MLRAYMNVPILYEDDNCIFIDKPAGISVHGDGKAAEYTLADWILENRPMVAAVGEPIVMKVKGGGEIVVPKPGIVHRLDKETSGVMLIAKTHDAYEFFKKQFQERETTKVYHCFAYGWIKEDGMHIEEAIGRDGGDIRKWTTGRGARGTIREATTDFTVLARFGDREYEGKGSTDEGTYSFVEARPKTGRTHQIRVHLRSINHPIVADSLYAPKRDKALGFERLALHARSLTVKLPGGEEKTVTASYPADFEAAIAKAGIVANA
jgi:23S rRNA pseudouridine1911/1915/1917 synthase